LLSAPDNRKQEQVVLAFQRYGRGKALAMPIQDSWRWRMNATIPVTDTTYATFWRRLGRWLVDDVPDRVMLTMTQDRVDPGQPMKLSAEVVDPSFTGATGPMPKIVALATALGVPIEKGAKLASGGYDVSHGTQVIGVVPGRRAPYVWTEGTDPSALAQDIKTILAKKVRSS